MLSSSFSFVSKPLLTWKPQDLVSAPGRSRNSRNLCTMAVSSPTATQERSPATTGTVSLLFVFYLYPSCARLTNTLTSSEQLTEYANVCMYVYALYVQMWCMPHRYVCVCIYCVYVYPVHVYICVNSNSYSHVNLFKNN